MSKNLFDQFSKQCLEEFLSPLGVVETSHEGQVQKQAISKVLAFDPQDPRCSSILKLLTNWKISLEVIGQAAEAEQEFIMALSQACLDWKKKTEERGLQQGLQQERALILR
jgi:hypothetical protein